MLLAMNRFTLVIQITSTTKKGSQMNLFKTSRQKDIIEFRQHFDSLDAESQELLLRALDAYCDFHKTEDFNMVLLSKWVFKVGVEYVATYPLSEFSKGVLESQSTQVKH